MPRWPLSIAGTAAAALVSGLVALAALLFIGGGPLTICWTGVGPAPEPATSDCVAAKIAALSPYDRLSHDEPLLAAVLLLVVAFLLTFLLIVVISLVLKRGRSA